MLIHSWVVWFHDWLADCPSRRCHLHDIDTRMNEFHCNNMFGRRKHPSIVHASQEIRIEQSLPNQTKPNQSSLQFLSCWYSALGIGIWISILVQAQVPVYHIQDMHAYPISILRRTCTVHVHVHLQCSTYTLKQSWSIIINEEQKSIVFWSCVHYKCSMYVSDIKVIIDTQRNVFRPNKNKSKIKVQVPVPAQNWNIHPNESFNHISYDTAWIQ